MIPLRPPALTYETPIHFTRTHFGRIDRRELRQRIAAINADLIAAGAAHIIGPLWRLERNHYFGPLAIYAYVPNPHLNRQIQ